MLSALTTRPVRFSLSRGPVAGEGTERGEEILSFDLQIFADYEPARWLQKRIPLLIPVARSAASASGIIFREHFSASEK